MADQAYRHLTTEREGSIERLTLNRPQVRNALNNEVVEELTDWAARVRGQGELRAVVLAGAGPSFSAGADISWMARTIEYSHEQNLKDAAALSRMFLALDTLPVPLIGRIQGAALGGGSGLAAVCDIVVAEEQAVFGFTEVKLGILPAVVSPFVLAKIGRSAARELFLTGVRFSAVRAREIGLVHRVVPPAALDDAVAEYLKEILMAGPEAVAAAKVLIGEVCDLLPGQAHARAAEAIAARRVSPEGQEGLRAFLEETKSEVGQVVLRRLLIANRGEIAVRVIRACRELGVESVAVYSEADSGAVHVSLADVAMAIGPASAADSYLSIERILGAAHDSGADSVHPGYGFLSENADLAAACERAGLAFVGPPSSVIASMGSKIEARRLVAAAGVPIVPGETPDDQSDTGVQVAADRVGYPLLVKASAGGGGKGMRRVDLPRDLTSAAQAARREALAAFDDGTLYVERLIDRPHHVEVQVMADAHGSVVHLFERECSVQRRHQKVIEETPSPLLTAALRARMTDGAVRAAQAVGYRNAGTIEFLVEPSRSIGDPRFYFLEMNTRLQVEHPITEAVIGVDLVQAQIRVASGEPLPWTQASLGQRGHAIEARVYAEAPGRGFIPQAGPLLLYREPRLPGVRVDSGVAEGDQISVHYDPLLAKVIASAETRQAAVARLVAALRDFPVLGIETNIPFLIAVLEHPRFRSGDVDTAFLDETADEILADMSSPAVPPIVAAAIAEHRPDAGGDGRAARQDWDPWSGAARRSGA